MEQRKLKQNWEEIYNEIHEDRIKNKGPLATLYEKDIKLLNSKDYIPCLGLDKDGDMEMDISSISDIGITSFLYGECFE